MINELNISEVRLIYNLKLKTIASSFAIIICNNEFTLKFDFNIHLVGCFSEILKYAVTRNTLSCLW